MDTVVVLVVWCSLAWHSSWLVSKYITSTTACRASRNQEAHSSCRSKVRYW
jgi:hypothetical protein